MNEGSKLCRVAVGGDQLQEHRVPVRPSDQQLAHLDVNSLKKIVSALLLTWRGDEREWVRPGVRQERRETMSRAACLVQLIADENVFFEGVCFLLPMLCTMSEPA